MEATAEILNNGLRMWAAVGIGVFVVTIVIAHAVGAILRSTRRLRDRRSIDQTCRAFAQAVARGDLATAEMMATLAFARDVRDTGAEPWIRVR